MSKLHDDMKKLIAAGKSEKAMGLVRQKASSAAGYYREVREDGSLSDAGKRQKLAGIYRQTRREVEREVSSMAAMVISTDRDDAANVLGVAGLPGDVASLAISRRDAGDRVAQVETRQEMQDLLRRATRSGDEVLARAVAEKALENLDDEVMNQFIEDRPKLDAAAQRLWDARRADTDTMQLTLGLADLAPGELFGLDAEAVVAIADSQPGAQPVPPGSPFARGGDAA